VSGSFHGNHSPRRGPARRRLVALAGIAALLLGACGSGAVPAGSTGTPAGSPSGTAPAAPSGGASAAGASGGPAGSAGLTHLVVGLGYIPSVQFAQFYLAQQAGYYRRAGLDVAFENKVDPDLVVLVGQGAIDIGIADGTSVIPAVSQDIPIRYVATIYGTFPNIVFAKTASGITTAADLKGKRVGTPCKCGSSWIMLQALLGSAGLTTSDVQVTEYPTYGQATAVARGAVDAATGFTNNEPLQLEQQGIAVTEIHVDQAVALPGPGLIAGQATIASKGAALRAFVSATLQAMRDIASDPQKGLDAAMVAVPELASQRDLQLKILQATIATWRSAYTDAHGLGAIDPAAWQASIAFMSTLPDHPVAKPITVDQAIDPSLLPGG
jgi:NitT/TauT family transport system substrate-binding protein